MKNQVECEGWLWDYKMDVISRSTRGSCLCIPTTAIKV
jgi:hypothetical protein